MGKITKGVMIVCMLLLFSCSKVIYTQNDVLSRYKTKNDVQITFGMPTEKQVGETSETWLYQFGNGKVELYHNQQTATVTRFSRSDRYLLFSFDKNGNVVRHDATGIDLAERKPKTGATIALIGGIVVAAATVAAIIALQNFHYAFDNWTP